MQLSRSNIDSFVGNVLPLHIGFDSKEHKTLSKADIKWSSSSDSVSIRSFSGDDPLCFNNGVLLVLKKPGTATVTAEYNGDIFTCVVNVRQRERASSEDELSYFIGDMHDHTSNIHNHQKFAERTEEFQRDYLNYIKNENLIDFGVISDHAVTINDTDFFRGFCEVEAAQPMDIVIFPGAEAEITVKEEDRFGIIHKNSGEIVTLNTDKYADAKSWQQYIDTIKDAPEPIAIFAHPQVIGFSTKGVWNFSFEKNNNPDMLRAIRGIEMGSGSLRQQNQIHEFVYSVALDNGFHVSTTCSSDSHGPVWGYHRFPGKTVIMAKEKSYEAFLDALRSNRFYGTESGNLKLRYTVNSMTAPCELPLATSYSFHVEVSYFHDDPTTVPKDCKVISDYGKTLLTITDVDFSSFDFEIDSDTARYFYLRFTDAEGRRTWSCPVWTGRKTDVYQKPDITQIDLSNACATDLYSGKDAYAAIDGNVENLWAASSSKASILIELQEEKTVKALGHYPRIINRIPTTVDPTWHSSHFTSTIPTQYEIYASEDGLRFKKCADGVIRVFGGETIITFEPIRAKYIRFDVLSNVGKDAIPEQYGKAKTVIANLSLFE